MNEHVLTRIAGINQQLMGVYNATAGGSSASKGTEREFFIDLFLSQVLPKLFRFGSGDATDQSGARSGQLDVVVEYPFLPSLPLAGGSRHRLYLAEAIAACIEVKSNVADQWDAVEDTSSKLRALKRNMGPTSTNVFGGSLMRTDSSTVMMGGSFSPGRHLHVEPGLVRAGSRTIDPAHIPIFAVGYKGWKTPGPIRQRLGNGLVDGVLVLDEPSLFVLGPRHGSAIGKAGQRSGLSSAISMPRLRWSHRSRLTRLII